MKRLCYQASLITGMLLFAACSKDAAQVDSSLDGASDIAADLDNNAAGHDTLEAQAKAEGHMVAGGKMTVTARHLNVRTGAGKNFKVKRVVKKGERVDVFEVKGHWVKIGEKEFVYKHWLK